MGFALLSFPAVIGAFMIVAWLRLIEQPRLPMHLLWHHVAYVPNLLSEEQAAGLRALTLTELKKFENIAKDMNLYTATREHIGEAREMGKSGACDHPLLIPSKNGTACVLPGRVDVARHYFRTGGAQGLREEFDVAASRLQPFARYIFDMDRWPVIRDLFGSESFLEHARSVCPADKQMLDPFQMNFILQVPGQTVAMHTDAPYFFGASRFHFPQWLLVAMVHSGLFKEYFVDQVQVVGYFHEWNATAERSGNFMFWRNSAREAEYVPPHPRSGTIVDGSKLIHASTIYQGKAGRIPKPPIIDKSRDCILDHLGNDEWEVRCDDQVMEKYTTDDVRMAIVYRGRCFSDQEELERFNAQTEADMMSLDDILLKFKIDLKKRRVITFTSHDQEFDMLDLAFKIIDTYIQYPNPPGPFPFNYCMLGKLYPMLKPVLSVVCAWP